MTTLLTRRDLRNPPSDLSIPDPHQDTFSRVSIGFWMYLMTDCLLFATLFTTYAVLHSQTFGGPTSQQLFHLSTAFIETMLLLFSSITCGVGMLCALRNYKYQVVGWFAITFVFGAAFITLELFEFYELLQAGHSWTRSAFLSAFFTLVGTHGLHVSIGLCWMAVVLVQVWWSGITIDTFRRLVVFSMFWHFLDLIWIFIFTFVYLIGVS